MISGVSASDVYRRLPARVTIPLAIYAAAVCQKCGFEIGFLDAPAKPLNHKQSIEKIKENGSTSKLFVVNTSTPSIFNDILYDK